MRAIIVDDERLSLDYLERLLDERPEVTLVATYTDPHQALAGIEELEPDVVFLDIEMPEITGIQLAEQIQTFSPRTKIVFVTAYREYAVQAFDLNAKRTGLYRGYKNGDKPWEKNLGLLQAGETLAIPENAFFALGDNSYNSADGRVWGFVPAKDCTGRPLFIYYPSTKGWGPAR